MFDTRSYYQAIQGNPNLLFCCLVFLFLVVHHHEPLVLFFFPIYIISLITYQKKKVLYLISLSQGYFCN